MLCSRKVIGILLGVRFPSLFFSGVEGNSQLFEIYILPGKAVNLAHSSQSVSNCPEVILHIWCCGYNHLVNVLL